EWNQHGSSRENVEARGRVWNVRARAAPADAHRGVSRRVAAMVLAYDEMSSGGCEALLVRRGARFAATGIGSNATTHAIHRSGRESTRLARMNCFGILHGVPTDEMTLIAFCLCSSFGCNPWSARNPCRGFPNVRPSLEELR